MKERKGETPALEESSAEGQERFRCRVDTHTNIHTRKYTRTCAVCLVERRRPSIIHTEQMALHTIRKERSL